MRVLWKIMYVLTMRIRRKPWTTMVSVKNRRRIFEKPFNICTKKVYR